MPLELLHSQQAARRAEILTGLAPLATVREPLVLEVGCGHGHFLTAYAQAHPEAFCIGIDLIKERIARAARKRDRIGLPRLHFLVAEARLFFECLPPATRLRDIYVLFPDPWPKKRHHKNRLLGPAFLATLARHAAPGARLFFRTDFEPYFRAVVHVLETQAQADWKLLPADTPWPFEQMTVFQERAVDGYHSLVAVARSSSDAAERRPPEGNSDHA